MDTFTHQLHYAWRKSPVPIVGATVDLKVLGKMKQFCPLPLAKVIDEYAALPE